MKDIIEEALDWFKANRSMITNFSQQLETVIKAILDSDNIYYHNISSRVKDNDSFVEKCVRKGYSDPINQNTDFCGIRIIAYTNSDVNKICYLLENEFCIDYENSNNKSMLLDVDKVGYRSIHYVIKYDKNRLGLSEYKIFTNFKCEVQVRTLLEHAWAEIEHDRFYKSKSSIPKKLKRPFNLISAKLEGIDNDFDSLINQIDIIRQNECKTSNEGVTTETLKEFILKRFSVKKWLFSDDQYLNELVINVTDYGLNAIGDIEKIIKKGFDNWAKRELTEVQDILWAIMILDNCERFFKLVLPRSSKISMTFKSMRNPFLYFGLDCDPIFKKISPIRINPDL